MATASRGLGPLWLALGAAGCAAGQRADGTPLEVNPSCSGTSVEPFHSMVCRRIVRSLIAPGERIGGRSSNEVWAAYEGTYRAPLFWFSREETECPTRADVTSETELEVELRRSPRCSERQWCEGRAAADVLYVPVSAELRTADGRFDESYEAWLAVTPSSTYLSRGFSYPGIVQGSEKVKVELEQRAGVTALRGFVEKNGVTGNFPTTCFWKCEAEPKLAAVESPIPALRALALVATRPWAPSTPQAGFPISFQGSAKNGHACIPQPGSMGPIERLPSYLLASSVRVRAANGALVATVDGDLVASSVPDCDTCALVTFSGTAPLRYQELLRTPDKSRVTAHVLLTFELRTRAHAVERARASLRVTYLHPVTGEQEELHELQRL